jgi:hypothetical protein
MSAHEIGIWRDNLLLRRGIGVSAHNPMFPSLARLDSSDLLTCYAVSQYCSQLRKGNIIAGTRHDFCLDSTFA